MQQQSLTRKSSQFRFGVSTLHPTHSRTTTPLKRSGVRDWMICCLYWEVSVVIGGKGIFVLSHTFAV